MKCPRCRAGSRIYETRKTATLGKKRYHVCRNGHRFTSYEKNGKRIADKESVR